MGRLTLSEQVNAQASQIAELTAKLHTAQATVAQLTAAEAVARKVPELQEALTKAQEEAKKAREMQTYYSHNADKATAELEQAHAVLDGVDGAPPRKYEADYGSGQRNVVTRLAGAFLAIAKNGGAK